MSEPLCANCGHPRNNHPFRHPFAGPSKDDTIKELEAKLAKAVEALDEAIYLLDVTEEDIAKGAGVYRIVNTMKELTGERE
jgi:hypothetical protein